MSEIHEITHSKAVDFVDERSRVWHTNRLNKKMAKSEMVLSATYGGLNSVEQLLVRLQENPDWTRDEIEAEFHHQIVNHHNYINKMTGKGHPVKLDEYLRMRGYFD